MINTASKYLYSN